MCIANAGFSLAHKDVHFDPFLPQMTPKTVQRGDSDVPRNSQMFLFQEVNVPQFLVKKFLTMNKCP